MSRPGSRTGEVTLVTRLLDDTAYPANSLAGLSWTLWRVEQNLRDLKQTIKMDVLQRKTVDGVLKELTAYTIVYNLVPLVMVEAGRRQGMEADRISFIDAMRWLIQAQPGDALHSLVVNPVGRDLLEPWVRKRRPKEFTLMEKLRWQLREIRIVRRFITWLNAIRIHLEISGVVAPMHCHEAPAKGY